MSGRGVDGDHLYRGGGVSATPDDARLPASARPLAARVETGNFADDCRRLAEQMMANPRVQARLDGEPHRHHRDCIHNLPPDAQIAMRGRTREWWVAMGLTIPVQIGPEDWAP